MSETTVTGRWTDEELECLADVYLRMLQAEIAGKPYVKRQQNIALQKVVNRTYASIEFKFCNLSAVLRDLGLEYIDGYKPRVNYQQALKDLVLRRIDEFPSASAERGVRNSAPDLVLTPRSSETFENEDPETLVTALFDGTDSILTHDVPDNLVPEGPSDAQTAKPVGASMPSDIWDALAALWERSTGGAHVADRPGGGQASHIPVAPRPAGVQEATEWFSQNLESATLPRFLFLIGGPGAGKSHASNELIKGLAKLAPEDDDLAHRKYTYAVGDRHLELINDATIPTDSQINGPLVQDLQEAISEDSHVVACVNRGVLIEEINHFAGKDPSEFTSGEVIARWLATTEPSDLPDQVWNIQEEVDLDYIRTGTLTNGRVVIAEVVAVFVDICSLFEKKPIPELGMNEESVLNSYTSNYQITDLFARADMPIEKYPAGELLTNVIKQISSYTFTSGIERYNPIAANIAALSSVSMQRSLLSIVRASEIVSGQRFTYREVWGLIARVIVGGLTETIESSRIEDRVLSMIPPERGPVEHFKHMRKLAEIRYNQALFGIDENSNSSDSDQKRNPVTRLTGSVDPMRDAIAGRRSSKNKRGWATPVTEAFSGPAIAGSPLQTLEGILGENDLFTEIVQPFDRELDTAFAEAMGLDSLTEQLRFDFIHWYGAYLGRLYALAHGIPAFEREVALWIQAWYLKPNLPPELESGLGILLRPKRNPTKEKSASLIPLFDSRTNPIVGNQHQPKLALQTSEPNMKTHVHGEELFLVLSEKAEDIALMPLDFAFVREATASSHDYAGLTELTETTSPRLERFRASLLVSRLLRHEDYRIVDGLEDRIITISKGGNDGV